MLLGISGQASERERLKRSTAKAAKQIVLNSGTGSRADTNRVLHESANLHMQHRDSDLCKRFVAAFIAG